MRIDADGTLSPVIGIIDSLRSAYEYILSITAHTGSEDQTGREIFRQTIPLRTLINSYTIEFLIIF